MVYIIMIIIVNLKFNFSSILTFNCWPHPRPQCQRQVEVELEVHRQL